MAPSCHRGFPESRKVSPPPSPTPPSPPPLPHFPSGTGFPFTPARMTKNSYVISVTTHDTDDMLVDEICGYIETALTADAGDKPVSVDKTDASGDNGFYMQISTALGENDLAQLVHKAMKAATRAYFASAPDEIKISKELDPVFGINGATYTLSHVFRADQRVRSGLNVKTASKKLDEELADQDSDSDDERDDSDDEGEDSDDEGEDSSSDESDASSKKRPGSPESGEAGPAPKRARAEAADSQPDAE